MCTCSRSSFSPISAESRACFHLRMLSVTHNYMVLNTRGIRIITVSSMMWGYLFKGYRNSIPTRSQKGLKMIKISTIESLA
jgi:hypothetical protein